VRTKRKSFARRYLMNKLNAVIFDLDGVICFTDKYHFQAWKLPSGRKSGIADRDDSGRYG
jgi:beta-phosphoglucomutase